MKRIITFFLCFTIVFGLSTTNFNSQISYAQENDASQEKTETTSDSSSSTPSNVVVNENGYTLSDPKITKDGNYCLFEALFTNTSDTNYSIVDINFSLKDKSGNKLEDESAYITNIAAGESFKVRKMIYKKTNEDVLLDESSIVIDPAEDSYSNYKVNDGEVISFTDIQEKDENEYLGADAIIKNNSDKIIREVSLILTLKNKENIGVDRNTINLSFLAPGQTYKFHTSFAKLEKDEYLDKDDIKIEYRASEEENLFDKEKFEITDINQTKDTISGVLKNNSGNDISYLTLIFDILDKDGNKISNTYSDISKLKNGETWKFEDQYYLNDENAKIDFEHPYIFGN